MKLLLDTGPLVAFLNNKDNYHKWACSCFDQLKPPLVTCDAVLAESFFLLRSTNGVSAIWEMINSEILRCEFSVKGHEKEIAKLMLKYKTIPMSLADACLVRMSELESISKIITMDSDFTLYRKHGRGKLDLIYPY